MKSFAYPCFLSLAGQKCLIIGFGKVGQRKLRGILAQSPAFVMIIDPFINGLPDEFATNSALAFSRRAWTIADIETSFLIFATTSSLEENAKIASACQAMGKLCNSASNPEQGNFILPATARQQNLCLALSTDGASPLLARLWKDELTGWVEARERPAWLGARLRRLALKYISADGQEILFKKIASASFAQWLAQATPAELDLWLGENAPQVPAPERERIIAEYELAFF